MQCVFLSILVKMLTFSWTCLDSLMWYLHKTQNLKLLRKGYPFQGPKLGSCLTLGNELSQETHVLTKQEILLGKGTRVESRRVREPRSAVLSCGLQSWVLLWWGFPGCLWPIILIQSLSWWHTHLSAKMDASERDFGKWTDTRCHLLTFPELFRLVVAY